MGLLKKNKQKKYPENYNENLEKLIEILKQNENDKTPPLSYKELGEKIGISGDDVRGVIAIRFRELTHDATRGYPDQDFYLFGDNIKPISDNFGYQVIKKRLAIKLERGI